MITHVVMWKFKEGVTEAERAEVIDGLAQWRDIPDVLELYVGENAGISQKSQGYTHMYIARFPDRPSHDRFQKHPLHRPTGPRLVERSLQLTVLDLEH